MHPKETRYDYGMNAYREEGMQILCSHQMMQRQVRESAGQVKAKRLQVCSAAAQCVHV